MWSLKMLNSETESRMAVAKGQGWGKQEVVGERVQTSRYKMSEFWGLNVQCVGYS